MSKGVGSARNKIYSLHAAPSLRLAASPGQDEVGGSFEAIGEQRHLQLLDLLDLEDVDVEDGRQLRDDEVDHVRVRGQCQHEEEFHHRLLVSLWRPQQHSVGQSSHSRYA